MFTLHSTSHFVLRAFCLTWKQTTLHISSVGAFEAIFCVYIILCFKKLLNAFILFCVHTYEILVVGDCKNHDCYVVRLLWL